MPSFITFDDMDEAGTFNDEDILGMMQNIAGIFYWRKCTIEQLALWMAGSWHTVGADGVTSFANNWINYGGAYAEAGYRVTKLLQVRLKGKVKSGTMDTPIFTLPAGYRPSGTLDFPVASNSAFGMVRIAADGTVVPKIGSNAWVDLANISFDVV